MSATAKVVASEVTKRLTDLLNDKAADARSIVDFIMGPNCGIESRHTEYGRPTSFLLVAQYGRLDVVRLLLTEHSLNTVAANDHGWTALHFAAVDNNVEMVRCLVEQGGALIDVVTSDGNTPLCTSIAYDHDNVALLLLELGANPHRANGSHNTPLHSACLNGNAGLARILLGMGADIHARTGNIGNTPLHCSVRHIKVVQLLLEFGASPNIANNSGQSPLHLLCIQGEVAVAMTLLANGAFVDVKDNQGMTPFDLAVPWYRPDMVSLLANEKV